MKRYMLDTGIASDDINHRYGVFEKADAVVRGGARIGVCVPVAGELLAGVELSGARERNMERLLRALKSLHIWPYEFAAAKEFGRLVAVLKRAGRTMQQIDVQIAAIAFTLGDCTVVSKDSDLFAVPGLDVENWAEPLPK
ncbi:MAG: type II toxin-antitoxin system VapC family toxin [Planctomycetaceae bacterium]